MATPKRGMTIRLSEAGKRRIADRAARADVDFSHMARRMLAYADQFMPEHWVPPRREAMERPRAVAGHERVRP